ncbi:MAG TPA: SulP family inorganic anion transporter [Ramlibacter sp.]|uniref:SulP family inorganic anion transporter n=1 Tax=Ramlibacter sp. TaxID=1917967 RepID=UPI002C89477B|nr:SulP family inorganic anion transporter [Ramlibacter sp.]HVZ46878.1 SulP family inorganic anion transporter [Ramlibacter sp.]
MDAAPASAAPATLDATSPTTTPAPAPTKSPGLLTDLAAGLAASLVAVPSALAFGVAVWSAADPALAGAGALAGIVGAFSLGIVAPLVGRNPGFITAPCAPAAAVLGGLAGHFAQEGSTSPERIVTLLALTALIAAALQIAYGALRVGRLIKYIPYQVVTGYLSGVALIIATTQLPMLLGAPGGAKLTDAATLPALWSWQAVVVGAATIFAMALAQKKIERVPAPIVALAVGALTYFVLGVFDPSLLHTAKNPLVVGPIETSGSLLDAAASRLAGLGAIDLDDVLLVLASAATLSVLLSIDTLKTGVVLDALLSRRHNSNRELFAQGTANFVSFALGGMPGAGTMGPTLVNVTSGARTIWASVAEGVFALLVLLVLAGAIAWVPLAALAGILLVVAFRMFDFGAMRLALNAETRLDFAIIATVIVVAQVFGLIQAAVAGIGLAILLFIRDQATASVILRKRDLTAMRCSRRRSEAESSLLDRHGSDGLVVELKDNLFFGTTDQLLNELEPELAKRRFILLDLRRVALMDYTAAHLFERVRHRLLEREGALLLCGMPSGRASRQDIQRYLDRVGLTHEGGVEIFETRDSALESMENRILRAAGWTERDERNALSLAQLPQLQGLPPAAVQLLARAIRDVALKPGEVLFKGGDAGDELFFVRSGMIHIRLPLEGGKHHHLGSFGRGELFGELAFLDRMSRSADAVATSETSLYGLSRERFDALAREEPRLAATLFERLASVIAHRLRRVDGELRELEER